MLFPLNRQGGPIQLSNSATSHSTIIQGYAALFCSFTSLPVSRTLGAVSTWLALHSFLQHLCVMIYVKYTSAQAAVNSFTGTSWALAVMKSLRVKHCCFFSFGLEEKAFERVKLAGEGVRTCIMPSSMLKIKADIH